MEMETFDHCLCLGASVASSASRTREKHYGMMEKREGDKGENKIGKDKLLVACLAAHAGPAFFRPALPLDSSSSPPRLPLPLSR